MISSLTTRIFAIFWLTLALVLMLVLMLPTFAQGTATSLVIPSRHPCWLVLAWLIVKPTTPTTS